jgi:hypothetical protein
MTNEKHTAFGPIVCERCHTLPQMLDGNWCVECVKLCGTQWQQNLPSCPRDVLDAEIAKIEAGRVRS